MKHVIGSTAGAFLAGIVAAAAPSLAHARAALQDQAAGATTEQAQPGVTGFAPGAAMVPSTAKPALDDLANAANRSPDSKIVIVGHTDNTGSAAHNQALALDRAQLVRSELARRGIDVNRISVQAGGAENPIASNGTRDGRRENRRAEVIIGDMESRMVGSSQGGTSASGNGEGEQSGQSQQSTQSEQSQQSGQTEENRQNEKYRQ